MKRLRVGILFGGRSGEHEVSLLSAASVMQAIDRSRFEVVPIGITKEGRWLTASHAEKMLGSQRVPSIAASADTEKHLRAGDPSATPGAALLAGGESVMVPPMPDANVTASPPSSTRSASSHAVHVGLWNRPYVSSLRKRLRSSMPMSKTTPMH